MLTEAIILAGGLGTRLKDISGDTPKPLVPVSGKPFVYYIMDNLVHQGISHIVFAISYQSDFFIDQIGEVYKGVKISYSVEKKALGTGGAIKQALDLCNSEHVLVTNGDTYVDIDLPVFYENHISFNKSVSIALVNVVDVARYGSVKLSGSDIVGFSEKGRSGSGLINGGMYLINKEKSSLNSGAYSFEDVFLKQKYPLINPFICNGFFIDIGIPSDYFKACEVF
ncbi:nucleotidyltransferase family protein [Lonsdalea quercina]|uniref:nucleotidyltransferase family protein n=1 Tax=Lonsdalea quercina TaxID=71657 RepID=UPI0039770EB4